ncbi:MAG: hypothetical protein RLZZ385_2314 [Pseudomonadota bacterium]|jgi:hypothetical protein
MVARLNHLLLALLLAGFAAPALAQAPDEPQVEVSVDRNEMARGETLTLTIRVFQQRQNIQLDLSPITSSFDILSTRTSSQIRSINNQVESWVDYIITLFPTEEGQLEIPALNINGVQTPAIPITVVDAGPNSSQGNNDLFLETEVNKESVFVQEQLLFTIRLYYTISGIRNPQFTELEMPDTVIQLIGSPNQYEKLIDGVRYGVYEKRYVIFPQRSGPLEIPDILFRGEVTDGSSNFVFRNLNTQRVTAYIEGTIIEVKERPASAMNLPYWLPAGNVSISETWSANLESLRVGDTANRTITLVAEGLDGAVLPPFSPALIDGSNLYPDPPDIQRTFVDGVIVGTRVEKTSIVPTASGFLDVPEIAIPWWDINSDSLQYARIPATRLAIATVDGQLPAEQTVASTGPIDQEIAAPVLDLSLIEDPAADTINIPVLWLNLAITLSVLIVLASIYWLVVRQFALDPVGAFNTWLAAQREKLTPEHNERVAFSQLSAALDSNDLRKIREAMIVWAVHYYAPDRILSMDDIIRNNPDNELGRICLQIQANLYNASSAATVDTARLKTLLATARRQQNRSRSEVKKQAPYQLPPLYKM